MSKQQTAVEWLEEICNNRGYNLMSEYFNQAKEMEKEQIIKANNNGCRSMMCMIDSERDGKNYYNETYGD